MVTVITQKVSKINKTELHHVINTVTGFNYGTFESKIGAENKAEQVNANLTLDGLILSDAEMAI